MGQIYLSYVHVYANLLHKVGVPKFPLFWYPQSSPLKIHYLTVFAILGIIYVGDNIRMSTDSVPLHTFAWKAF